LEDRDGFRYELRYIRDKEGREVDFAIVKEGAVEELVEVKYSDESPSRSLSYYAERLNPVRATQIVATLKHPSRFQLPFARVNSKLFICNGLLPSLFRKKL